MQLEPHILYYEHISCQSGDIEEFLKENLRDNVIFYGFFYSFYCILLRSCKDNLPIQQDN